MQGGHLLHLSGQKGLLLVTRYGQGIANCEEFFGFLEKVPG